MGQAIIAGEDAECWGWILCSWKGFGRIRDLLGGVGGREELDTTGDQRSMGLVFNYLGDWDLDRLRTLAAEREVFVGRLEAENGDACKDFVGVNGQVLTQNTWRRGGQPVLDVYRFPPWIVAGDLYYAVDFLAARKAALERLGLWPHCMHL